MELFGLSREELGGLVESLGQPKFRAAQLADWIYRKSVRDFGQMTNLPASLREELARTCTLTRAEAVSEARSDDGAVKFLLRLGDGECVESVLLPYADRVSVCVSTQIGCSAGCTFCATADGGLVRNLTPGEIVDQVLVVQERSGMRVSHVVFMGMGEPLLNLPAVLKAVRLLNDEAGISMRRMTLSTVGITPAIRRLAQSRMQLTLAVSLHAPDEELRRRLIPVSSRFPLPELIQACRDYAQTTKRRITFEYLLLAGVNDTPAQAAALARLLKGIMCHVNLIPYNEVDGKLYRRPDRRAVQAFRAVLEKAGVEVTQRMERGHSAAAACGQLRARRARG